MGSNTLTGSNFNISGVNALTINDPGEGIIFTGTNTFHYMQLMTLQII